jgi:hypothetical protein
MTGRLRGLLERLPRRQAESGSRVAALEARVDHLEAQLEGLQDALHRLSVRHDSEIEKLTKGTRPDEMARALSEDARRRGL